MISVLDNLPDSLFEDDAALIKIHCLYFAFKEKEKIATFYKQTDENGNTTAIMSFAGGNLNLWQKNADIDELKSYIEFVGAKNIFTAKSTAALLDLKSIKPCFLMKVKQDVLNKGCVVCEDTPRSILKILKTGLTINNDDEFLADVTYRLYHNAAGCAIEENGAGIMFKSKVAGFIGGLAVLPECRKTGVGSRLLTRLREQSTNENFFVCCEEKNIGFYNKNGFAVVGEAGDFGVNQL